MHRLRSHPAAEIFAATAKPAIGLPAQRGIFGREVNQFVVPLAVGNRKVGANLFHDFNGIHNQSSARDW